MAASRVVVVVSEQQQVRVQQRLAAEMGQLGAKVSRKHIPTRTYMELLGGMYCSDHDRVPIPLSRGFHNLGIWLS